MNQAQRIIVSVAALGFASWFWGACEFNDHGFRSFYGDRLAANLGWFFATAGFVLYRLWKTKKE
jgi:hypothetical protein